MNHYIYQITNNINGKIYIGKRSCKCDIKDDTYFGSDTRLRYAIKKYGKENFSKTIIDICDSPETAYELEELIVDAEFLKRSDTYNLCGGGIGPSCVSDETKAKMSANHDMKGKKQSPETIAKIKATILANKLAKQAEKINRFYGINTL